MKLRKSLAVILSVAALLGCGRPGSSSSGTASVGTGDYNNLGLPSSIEITTMSFFNNYDDGYSTVNERKEWTDAMSERYNTVISVIVPADEDIFQTTYASAATGELTGLLELQSYNQLQYLIEQGKVLPLDDYLANNSAWKALPQQMRDMYKINGKVYAVPSCFYYTMKTRSYETEVVSKSGVTVPATLEEFKTFAKKIIDEKVLQEYQSVVGGGGTGLSWAQDFLNAFGVYIDSTGQFTIAYDPDEQAYIDPFLTNKAELALQYLRELYEMGALNWDFDVLDASTYMSNIESGMYVTYYGPASQGKYNFGITVKANQIYNATKEWPSAEKDWSELSNYFTESYTMSGAGTNGSQLLYPVSTPYVLLSGTAQPAETVNFFVDLLFSSESNYLEAYIGLPENYVRNADGTIQMKMVLSDEANTTNDEEGYVPRHQAGLVDKVEGLYSNANVFISYMKDEGAIARQKEMYDYTNRQLSEALVTRAVTKMPGTYSSAMSAFLVQNFDKVYEIFYTCYTEAISNKDTTVAKELEKYRADMRALGADQILQEANAAIGKQVTQTY